MSISLLSLCSSVLFAFASGLNSSESSNKLAVVTATQGQIIGQVTNEAAIFWGIPYSQAPVGKWRWKPPRNPVPFKESYWNATQKGAACMQYCTIKRFKWACPAKMSENCLFLNVFVPRQILKPSNLSQILNKSHYAVQDKFTKGGAAARAVMVWLHGGNFIQGSGSNVLYDGRFLAHRGDVVVVTLNYRLGPFGFLVQGTGKDAAKGNYGIFDQIKALEWVKNNIKYFGGNPNKITLFGESAGAESISIMMTSPLGKGLFHQAIYESDPLALPYRNIREARRFGSKFAHQLGCTAGNMTCLRNLDAEKIVSDSHKRTNFFSLSSSKMLLKYQEWSPTIDGNLMLEHPMVAFKKGKFYPLPVIMGYDVNEAYLFIELAIPGPSLSTALYELFVTLFAKNSAPKILQQYPPCTSANCSNKDMLREITNDFVFKCPTIDVEYLSRPASWLYTFNASLSFQILWQTSFCSKRACHGSELAYVFDTTLLTSMFRFTTAQTKLSHKMQYYWTNFAKFGNPNGRTRMNVARNWANAEYWDRFYDYSNGSYRSLDLTSRGNHILYNPHRKNCEFWDGLNVYGKY